MLQFMWRSPKYFGLVRWARVAACVLLLCGWIGTFWSVFGYQNSTMSINLWGGCLEISAYPAGTGSQGWFAAWQPYEVYWLPEFIYGKFSGARTTHLFLPLWMPLLVLGPTTIITTMRWWKRNRRLLAGDCRKCGYDLTGNTSGACPECGAAIAPRHDHAT